MTAYDAIVLAGGSGRRLGGADKAMVEVGGRSLLDRVVDACEGADRVFCVGPRRDTARAVGWCREEPLGGGPVAGLAAGLQRIGAEVVVVLAADLPFVAGLPPVLVAAIGSAEGAVLVDGDGRPQPLAAAYRTAALRERLGRLGRVDGAAVRGLVAGMLLVEVPDAGGAALDCDTWADVCAARIRDGSAP